MALHLTDDKSTLVKVTALCRQVTSQYLPLQATTLDYEYQICTCTLNLRINRRNEGVYVCVCVCVWGGGGGGGGKKVSVHWGAPMVL